MERNVKEIEENNKLLDQGETDTVRLILYILSYCKAVQRKEEYIAISEGFVRQSHAVIEEFLENELGYKLPDAFDDEENEKLRDLYRCYYSDEFKAI